MISLRKEFTLIPHDENAVKKEVYSPAEVLLRAGYKDPQEILDALASEGYQVYHTVKYFGDGDFK